MQETRADIGQVIAKAWISGYDFCRRDTDGAHDRGHGVAGAAFAPDPSYFGAPLLEARFQWTETTYGDPEGSARVTSVQVTVGVVGSGIKVRWREVDDPHPGSYCAVDGFLELPCVLGPPPPPPRQPWGHLLDDVPALT